MSDEAVERDVRRLTRRGFITAAVAAGAGYGGWKWLRSRPREGALEWPLRRMLETNESLFGSWFSPTDLSPTFRPSDITRPPRVNGHLGLIENVDMENWRLKIEGAAAPVTLTFDDIQKLPQTSMITELRCIEGWSMIVKWTGVRLSERDDPATVAAAANGRPVVLVLRDAARHAWQRDVAALLPHATVIETGLPGFPAALETHGAGRANLEAAVAVLSTAG